MSQSKQKTYIVAKGKAKPDQVDQVRSILLALMKNTQLEEGCLQYQVMQNRDDPTEFVTIEQWSDQVYVDAHFLTAHFREAMVQMDGLLQVEPQIKYYQPVLEIL
jgi:quinol monooxygenase YgiN